MVRPLALTVATTILALMLLQPSLSIGQSTGKDKEVKLIDWKAQPCDDSYDPYRLVTRITEVRVEGENTFITVNFTENCCAEFKPQIAFKDNKLFLMPYDEYSGDKCFCGCCFSIQYVITGLPTGGYETYFHGMKTEISNDHYKVVQPTSEVYHGETINRTNRYGFKEDLWMTFDKRGNVTRIDKYPESVLYREPRPIWTKEFYPAGQLSRFERKDTTESWFEDGALRSEYLDYKVGDTTYQKVFSLYNNRHVYKRSLERSYPITLRSELDPEFKKEALGKETLYAEEYFNTGKPKLRFGQDTTYTWHENGKIASREFKNGKIEYDADGFVTKREFQWFTKGPAHWGDLQNSLHAKIGHNGKVREISYMRYQGYADSVGAAYYDWTWDGSGKSIKSPKEWNEPFPWTKFSQLIIP